MAVSQAFAQVKSGGNAQSVAQSTAQAIGTAVATAVASASTKVTTTGTQLMAPTLTSQSAMAFSLQSVAEKQQLLDFTQQDVVLSCLL
ncbi:hypothetical protein WJX79_006931 [Trebouxia sp. C0005]